MINPGRGQGGPLMFRCRQDREVLYIEEDANKIRDHERTGRALGSDSFLELLELSLMRAVKRRKAGRRRKQINKYGVPIFPPTPCPPNVTPP